MEKIKTALIGIGKWGQKLAPVLDKYTELSYIVHTGSLESSKWIEEHFTQQKSTKNLEEVLNDSTVIAVVIATPINTHFEIAMRALKSGKHVFLEKPGTDSSEKLAELTEEADKQNLVLQIGYEFTFTPHIKEMRDVLENKNVSKISFKWHKWGTFDFHPVINLLVHELSILKTLGVWPINITKYEENTGEHNPDSIYIEAKSGDINITFEIDRTSQIKEKIITFETTEEKTEWKDPRTPLIDLEIEAFVNAIQLNIKPIPDGHFAKDILKTIETISYKR